MTLAQKQEGVLFCKDSFFYKMELFLGVKLKNL